MNPTASPQPQESSDFIPYLPNIKHLPFYVATDAILGALYAGIRYAAIGKVNPLLTVTIFAIRGLADNLFFLLANTLLKGKNLHSQKIFITTSAIVNTAFMVSLRELNLMERLPAFILGLIGIAFLGRRIKYIHDKESASKP